MVFRILKEIVMVTKIDIERVQQEWGNAVVYIGKAKGDREERERRAKELIDRLYNFSSDSSDGEMGEVLFKPTKTSEQQFRSTPEGALSYFVGGNDKYSEDKGFALQPWSKVEFDNANYIIEDNRALVMGNYFFTDDSGEDVKVEFTFGFRKRSCGQVKIDLHHSSLPYMEWS